VTEAPGGRPLAVRRTAWVKVLPIELTVTLYVALAPEGMLWEVGVSARVKSAAACGAVPFPVRELV
jgi:hypothetical protein